ncbi:helix-turn-helix transcriptional regulator [Ornithinimicrobium sp. Y1847]|uniref:helix-turn-helix transcriptional regulator n=1 Tax=Ornithinimicrobium sp. Y1847 TaxID=3405419 RepID=UPI003B66B9A2
MRADRLVSLVLLLRQRGRMTAAELAAELEVSTRTVLRDMEALSTAGVPVYADRGRHGGFSLLPGFRTELTGLSQEEALALFTAGCRGQAFGLSAPLAAAMRKVVDALPTHHQSKLEEVAQRLLVEPQSDLLSKPVIVEAFQDGVMDAVRRGVLAGQRLRIEYAPAGSTDHQEGVAARIIDPLGLVTVRGRTYLLATKEGLDRTYRVSRIVHAEVLAERARRPESVDLAEVWAQRCASFLSSDHLHTIVRVRDSRRQEVLDAARGVSGATPGPQGWVDLEITFDDVRHAVWAVWQLGADAEVLSPDEVRIQIHDRATRLVERYQP